MARTFIVVEAGRPRAPPPEVTGLQLIVLRALSERVVKLLGRVLGRLCLVDHLLHRVSDVIKYGRFGNNLLHPPTRRERLLAEIRKEVLASISNGLPPIEEIAKGRGMSRVRFTQYFTDAAGLTPARFIAQVRISEVARLLINSDLKLSDNCRSDRLWECRQFVQGVSSPFSDVSR
jgi:AraC-like DNA-binding protein